jgi:hypothetical protein
MDAITLRDASRRLVTRSREIITELDLEAILGSLGRMELIGSSSFGLMVKPDIDIGTLCPALDAVAIWAALTPLTAIHLVKELHFFDERGRFNATGQPEDEGVYCGVYYVDGDGAEAPTWKIDLWFFPEDAPRPEFPLRDRLLAASDDERDAILLIKRACVDDGSYGRGGVHGIDVYVAVLDHGVRTLDEWKAHRASVAS